MVVASHPRRAFAGDAARSAVLSAAKAIWWGANGVMARRVTQPTRGMAAKTPDATAKAPDRSELRNAWMEAFRKDAADVRAGIYPVTERLQSPVKAIRHAIDFLTNARDVDNRRRRADGVEVRYSTESDAYPNYYRQNFHYQTGGWFTADSARRYEGQVEALFAGTAGPMRRRALSLLARALGSQDQRDLKIADAACGAGAFLMDLRATFPRSTLLGIDLSAPYLEEARKRSGAAVLQANLEHTPLADDSLDALTCIYLFHELPPRIRPLIAAEFARVLKPGGLLAFADSVQARDAPELARLLEVFPVFFHEPFYESFQSTDLTALFAQAGLVEEARDTAFLTTARLFRKTV